MHNLQNILLKSAPPRLLNWQIDKLVIMAWHEQWRCLDWHAKARGTPSLTLGALQATVVSHGAEELKDEDGDSHHWQAHHKHHHPHRRAVGLCNAQKNTQTPMQTSDKVIERCPSSTKPDNIKHELEWMVDKKRKKKKSSESSTGFNFSSISREILSYFLLNA